MAKRARLHQVSGKGMESLALLGNAETLLREEISSHAQNADAMSLLALVLTRAGKFPEALVLAQKALQRDGDDALIKYRLAQMYSLQLYSGKTMSVDEDLMKLATSTLKEALARDYRFDELANADFFNMYEHADFRTVIEMPLK